MTDPNFNERNEHELNQLDDARLLDYIRRAREAGRAAAMTVGVRLMVWRYLRIIEGRVGAKVPRHDVDEVVGDVIDSAMKAAFGGTSEGEFHNWIHTIIDRRVADYHRKNRLETTRLPDGSEETGGREIPQRADEGVVDVQRAIETAVGEMSELHRKVIDLYVFADMGAGDVAAATGETEANVHQIGSRFRKALKKLLNPDGDTGASP